MSIEKIFFFCDAPEFAQLRLQDPSTTTMEGLLEFNKHLLFVITVIVMLVAWLVIATISMSLSLQRHTLAVLPVSLAQYACSTHMPYVIIP